jgi:hypothetical protein
MADPTTNAATRRAFEEHRIVQRRESDPETSGLEGGEIWYRTDNDEFRAYVAGTGVVTLNTTAV